MITLLLLQALVITGPGVRTLTSDLSDADTVISVQASDVVINLNGKTVRCTGDGINYGINGANRGHITINGPGTITGCWMGVQFAYGAGHVIHNGVDLTGNRYIGANLGYGYQNTIKNVVCGSIAGYPASGYAICINGIGARGLIEDVVIGEMYRQPGSTEAGEGLGILVDAGANDVRLKNVQIANSQLRPNTMGIWMAGNAIATGESVTIDGMSLPVGGFGTYTEVEPPDPPDPPDPPPGNTLPFTVCFGEPLMCYSGTLTKVTP